MATVRERWSSWAEQHVRSGLCVRCGKNPPAKGKQQCLLCLRKGRLRRTRRYDRRLQAGLCPHCGGKREDPGIIGCQTCVGKIAASRITDPARKALYQNRFYHKRLREHRCPTCGRVPEDTNFKMCSQCRKLRRGYYYLDRTNVLKERHIRYLQNHKPKPTCNTCGLQRFKCNSCGKMMKTDHGKESCQFTCGCGNILVKR